MSGGIQGYGDKGVAIASAARSLHAQKLLTDAQLAEVTNGTFSQRDFEAANAAMAKAMDMPQLRAAKSLSDNFISLRSKMTPDPNDPKMGLGDALWGLVKVMMQ